MSNAVKVQLLVEGQPVSSLPLCESLVVACKALAASRPDADRYIRRLLVGKDAEEVAQAIGIEPAGNEREVVDQIIKTLK